MRARLKRSGPGAQLTTNDLQALTNYRSALDSLAHEVYAVLQHRVEELRAAKFESVNLPQLPASPARS
jgi:hypothetical protein